MQFLLPLLYTYTHHYYGSCMQSVPIILLPPSSLSPSLFSSLSLSLSPPPSYQGYSQ